MFTSTFLATNAMAQLSWAQLISSHQQGADSSRHCHTVALGIRIAFIGSTGGWPTPGGLWWLHSPGPKIIIIFHCLLVIVLFVLFESGGNACPDVVRRWYADTLSSWKGSTLINGFLFVFLVCLFFGFVFWVCLFFLFFFNYLLVSSKMKPFAS